MELFIMDEKFKNLYTIDLFESLIWTERFNGYGDFEIYVPINEYILEVIYFIQDKLINKLDVYVWLKESKKYMIIENIEITTNSETGNHVTISGRGLESILERRIIWEQTTLDSSLVDGIKTLINDSIINPKIIERKIPNFIFLDISDLEISKMTIKAQYTGDNLYETIYSICESYGIGFNIDLDSDNNFVFYLYKGVDRSYDQNKNPYVVFSPNFENIINSDYLESIKTLRNVTLIAGEDISANRKTIILGNDKELSRRELYTDARDIQSTTENGVISDSQYNSLLIQRGNEQLSKNKYTKIFTGEIEAKKSFIYGRDFYLGDIVQVVNEFNIKSKSIVSEMIKSQDSNGYSMYPNFQDIVSEEKKRTS